jgi:hypothetical protein
MTITTPVCKERPEAWLKWWLHACHNNLMQGRTWCSHTSDSGSLAPLVATCSIFLPHDMQVLCHIVQTSPHTRVVKQLRDVCQFPVVVRAGSWTQLGCVTAACPHATRATCGMQKLAAWWVDPPHTAHLHLAAA